MCVHTISPLNCVYTPKKKCHAEACLERGLRDVDCCGRSEETGCAAGWSKSIAAPLVCYQDDNGLRFRTCCVSLSQPAPTSASNSKTTAALNTPTAASDVPGRAGRREGGKLGGERGERGERREGRGEGRGEGREGDAREDVSGEDVVPSCGLYVPWRNRLWQAAVCGGDLESSSSNASNRYAIVSRSLLLFCS